MILVAGGTGTVGTRLTRLLAEHAFDVRVLTRDPASVPDQQRVETAAGDVRDPASLGVAVAGAHTVVSAVTGFAGKGDVNPRTVDGDGNSNLIAATRAAGVEHFILLSIYGTGPDHRMELYRMKHRAEQDLMASGLAWTILRPTVYMETWGGIVGSPIVRTGKTRVFGRGNNPINFVSAHDVAGFIELAITDPQMRYAAVDVGGPENLTMMQVVEAFEAAVGRRAQVRHVPVPMLRAMAILMRPLNPTLARFAQAGLLMDTADMSFDASDARRAFPSLLLTSLTEVVQREFVGSRANDPEGIA